MEPSVQLRVLATSPAWYFHFTSWGYIEARWASKAGLLCLRNKDCCQVTVSYKFIAVTLNRCFPTQVNLLLSTGLSANAVLKYFRPATTGTSLGFRPRKSGRICSWRDKSCVGVLFPGTKFRPFCIYERHHDGFVNAYHDIPHGSASFALVSFNSRLHAYRPLK